MEVEYRDAWCQRYAAELRRLTGMAAADAEQAAASAWPGAGTQLPELAAQAEAATGGDADADSPARSAAPLAGCDRSGTLRAYKPLVSKIARRLAARLPANVEMDELMQAGLIGLNEAVERFEAERGIKFDTYASRRIEGAMLDSLRAFDPVTRTTRSRLRQVRQAVHRLEHQLGRTPRAVEVAHELEWPLQRLHDCLVEAGAAGMRVGDEALDQADDEAAAYGEAMQASGEESRFLDDQGDPTRALLRKQRSAALNEAFDALEQRERQLMELLYQHDHNHQQAGEALGVSESRISQMHSAIVGKLRRRMVDL